MNRIFRRRNLAISLTIALIALLAFFLRVEVLRPAHATEYPITRALGDFKASADHWQSRIVAVGAKDAYQEMANEALALPGWHGHQLAHSFGEALFTTMGMDGLGVCDDQFVYGCYHQFTGNAIREFGLPILEHFRNVCEARKGHEIFPCLHGMGHGILGYLGYTRADLVQALSLCNSPKADIPTGCATGVFMEYDIRQLAAYESGNVDPRPFSPESPYEPCFDVDSKFQASCIREQPNWWVNVLPAALTLEERFTKAGTYCSGIEGEQLRNTCFEGIGHILPPATGLDINRSAVLCAGAAEKEDLEHCLFGVVRRFRIEGYAEYRTLCDTYGFIGAAKDRCLVAAD